MPRQDAPVDRVVAVEGPGVQAVRSMAEAVLAVGAGAGHEAVE